MRRTRQQKPEKYSKKTTILTHISQGIARYRRIQFTLDDLSSRLLTVVPPLLHIVMLLRATFRQLVFTFLWQKYQVYRPSIFYSMAGCFNRKNSLKIELKRSHARWRSFSFRHTSTIWRTSSRPSGKRHLRNRMEEIGSLPVYQLVHGAATMRSYSHVCAASQLTESILQASS